MPKQPPLRAKTICRPGRDGGTVNVPADVDGELLGIRLLEPHRREVKLVRQSFADWVTEVGPAFPEIRHLLLTGSRARGDHRPDSDFDVLIELDDRLYSPLAADDPPFGFDVVAEVPESRFGRPPTCHPNVEVERRIAYDERVHPFRLQVDLTFIAPPPFRGQWKHWHRSTGSPICVNWDIWPSNSPAKVIYERIP